MLQPQRANTQVSFNAEYIQPCVSQECKAVAHCKVQKALYVAASFPWSFLGYNCCFGFRHVKVYCNSDNALAGPIREIRNVSLYFPGFHLCELKEFVYVASTF